MTAVWKWQILYFEAALSLKHIILVLFIANEDIIKFNWLFVKPLNGTVLLMV